MAGFIGDDGEKTMRGRRTEDLVIGIICLLIAAAIALLPWAIDDADVRRAKQAATTREGR